MDWITVEELRAAAKAAKEMAARGGLDFAYRAYWNGYEDALRHLVERYEIIVGTLEEARDTNILANLEKYENKL